MKWLAGFVLVILVLGVGVGVLLLGGGRGPGSSTGGGMIEIVMEEMRFTPNRIDAKVDQAIVLRLVNRGAQRHDLIFPSLHMPGLEGQEAILEPGEVRTISLRFDTPGEHTFLCSLPGHAAAGMTGAVFVRS